MKPGVCKLCRKEALLQRSHILPKNLIKSIRGEKGHVLDVTGTGRYGINPRQDGLKEELLCRDCETFCNDKYEKPFQTAWRQLALPNPWIPGRLVTAKVDYAVFKLFHLLNLFRSSVSELRELARVRLGPHQEILRQMLLAGDAGNAQRYAVAGLVLYDQHTRSLLQTIGYPERYTVQARTHYRMIYLSTEWIVLISAGGGEQVRQLALREDGTLVLKGHPYQGHPVLHEMWSRIADKELLPGA